MSILWQIIRNKSFFDVSYQRRPLAGTKLYVSQWWFLTSILLIHSLQFLFELFYSFSILTFIFFFSYFEWQAQMSLLWQLTRNQKCYAKPYQYLPWPAQMSILWRIIRYKTVIAISYQYQTSTGTKFYVSQWWFLTAILLIYFFLFEFELFYSISILTFIFFFSYFKWQVQMSILRQFTRM